MLKQSFKAIEPQRLSDVAPSQSLPTVRETVSGSLSVSFWINRVIACRDTRQSSAELS